MGGGIPRRFIGGVNHVTHKDDMEGYKRSVTM
jgi:hypothetical protein